MRKLPFIVFISVIITACGFKGPLYFPKPVPVLKDTASSISQPSLASKPVEQTASEGWEQAYTPSVANDLKKQ